MTTVTARIRTLCAGGIVLLASSSARPARAATIEPIVLTYETTSSCPTRDAFIDQVRAYTTGWEAVPEGAPATRSIHVVTSAGTKDASGAFAVVTADGKTSERRLTAPTCEAVTRALALMVAVAIDPDALAKGPTLAEAETKSVEPPPAPVSPPPPEKRAPAVAAMPPESEAASPHYRIAVELRAEVTSAVVSRGMPVIGAALSFEPTALVSRAAPWVAPTFALGVRQSLPTETSSVGGSTRFLWTAGNLRACPLRFGGRSVLGISLCAEMDLGRLSAQARGFDAATEGSFAWLDFQASSFASVRLTKTVFLEANAAIVAPYSRRRFLLSNGDVISRAPPIGPIGGLGVGAKF